MLEDAKGVARKILTEETFGRTWKEEDPRKLKKGGCRASKRTRRRDRGSLLRTIEGGVTFVIGGKDPLEAMRARKEEAT